MNMAGGNVKGLFISFEGADGCGKSTQARRLAETLQRRGVDVVATREPGGTALGQKLRTLLLDSGDDGPVPVAEMLLLAADRAQHVQEVIAPALARGRVVISDRFIDSSIAYQAVGLGLPEDEVRAVNLVATGGLWPDMTIWLDIDPSVGLGRAGVRPGDGDGGSAPPTGRLDRIERRGLPFQQRVVAAYERLAAAEPQRWTRLAVTNLSEQEVAERVVRTVEPLLRKAGWDL